MAKTILIYHKKEDLINDPPLIRYAVNRVKRNQNFMMVITGKTGSGKTYLGMRYAEELAQKLGKKFDVNNIAFHLDEWLEMVEKAERGSIILFDEPQISISSKEAMSRANKIFNYIASTFRVKNLIIIFCTPYDDFIDKSARKLLHCKLSMLGIDYKKGIATAKPVLTEYNSFYQNIVEQFIRTYHMYDDNVGSKVKKYVQVTMKKPSDDLIDKYEEKKMLFLNELIASARKEAQQIRMHRNKGKSPRKSPKNE